MERRLKEKLPGGVFSNVSPVRSRTMAAIKAKHAKTTERALRMALVRAGITGWQLHANHLPGKPDFFFPRHQLAIFVDGCFWHGCSKCGHVPKTNSAFWTAKIKRNIERDRSNTRVLRKLGIATLRIWEHSLSKTSNRASAIHRIRGRLELIDSSLKMTK